jgi:hypothetical protein
MSEGRKLTGKVAMLFGGSRGIGAPLPDAWREKAPTSV